MTRTPAAHPAKPPGISAIVVCKDRLEYLKDTLPLLTAQPFAEVILVDFQCPQRAGDWVESAFPAVRVVRVTDRPQFNVAVARNRGAAIATAPWLFFVDVDVLLAPEFLASTFPRLQPGAFLIGDPKPPELWGTMFVERTAFEAIAGYDEVFEGWGVEDTEILDRLEFAGLRKGFFAGELARPILHSDELRTRYHEVKDRSLNGAINEFYRAIKADLTRQGKVLDQPGRERLYAQIRAGFANGWPPKTFEIAYHQTSAFGLYWKTSFKYELETDPDDPQAPIAWAKASKSPTA